MTQSDQKTLETLRTQILSEIAPLIKNSNFDPSQKFNLLLSIARESGETSDFSSAHEAASQIKEDTDRANALLDLLEELDVALGNIEFTDQENINSPEQLP